MRITGVEGEQPATGDLSEGTLEGISPPVFNLPLIIIDDLLKEIPGGGNRVGFSVT
jgi:hypothetical protein